MEQGKKFIKKKDDREILKITLDTETRGLEGDVFRIGIYDGKKYYVGNTFQELQQQLLSYNVTYNVHIFIHNLKFDFSKMIRDLKGKIIWSESLYINNKPAIIKTADYTFHDTMVLLGGASLKTLCEDFKVENQKIDMIDKLWNNELWKSEYIIFKETRAVTCYDRKNDKKYKLIRKFEKIRKNVDEKKTMGLYFKTVDPNDKLLNEYLEYDCRSLYEIMDKVTKVAPISEEDFMKCPTSASLSMKTFQKHPLFKKKYELACKTKWENRNNQMEEIMKAGYYGGRTEVFIPRLFTRGYHYDMNSEYPFAMSKPGNLFPIGDVEHLIGIRAKIQWRTYLKKQKGGGIVEATVYSPDEGMLGDYPILPLKHNGKLIFPKKEFTGTWTMPELYFAMTRGVEIREIHQMIYFWRTEDLFSEFVHYFEKLKMDNTPLGGEENKERDAKCNPTLRQISKTILNSLYGKFATKRERDSFVGFGEIEKILAELEKKKAIFEPEIRFFKDFIDGGQEYAENNYFKENHERKIIGRMPLGIKPLWIDENIFKYTTYLTQQYIQIQISAYVTSYARIELYKGFENIYHRGGKIYYSDTDSLVCDIPLDPEMIHPTEFGKWELEGKKKGKKLIKGRFYQPKSYMEEYEDIIRDPDTIKIKEVVIHYKNGKTETRFLDISQRDITTKFKGADKEVRDNLRFGDMDYYLTREQKQDVDKITLQSKEEGKENLINTIIALQRNLDPNTMIPISKSINIQGSIPKRKFDIENNKSIPWSVDPNDPDYINNKKFDTTAYNQMVVEKSRWNPFDVGVYELGKIKIPARNTKQYDEYIALDSKKRKKYFARKGVSITEFADFIESHPDDLFYDLKWQRMN